MKKVLLILLGVFAFMTMQAQYVSTEKGTQNKIKITSGLNNNVLNESIVTVTVTDVDTIADGLVSIKTLQQVASNTPVGTVTEYSTSYYNPTTLTTTYFVADKDETKSIVAKVLRNIFQSRGIELSIEKLNDLITVSGDLRINLQPKTPAGTEIPNQTMSVYFNENEVMQLNMFDGVFLGEEDIEVNAGTFHCLKLKYAKETFTQSTEESYVVTSWFAPEVGEVLSVWTDEDGNEVTKYELIEIKKF